MAIKRWESGFMSTVYRALYGSHSLKQIYYGSHLVFDAGSEFNYFDTTPGTRTVTIPAKALYNIQLVGGGGGGSYTYFDYGGYWWSYGSSAGSGSYVYGWEELEPGTYTITVGAGGGGYSAYFSSGPGGTGGASTAFGETANGGTGGNGSTHGTGGTAAPDVLSGQNGNNGEDRGTSVGSVSAPNVASPYDNNVDGIGHGGGCGGAGGNGLVAISYMSPPLSPLWSSSTPGTYTITIPVTALYEVILVGGGGGAASTYYYDRAYNIARAGGGSGSYVYGKVKITAGTYTVTVGAGGTAPGQVHASTVTGGTGGSSIFLGQEAGGGTGGIAWFENTVTGTQATAGTGGTATITSPYTSTNGNSGTAKNNSWGVQPVVEGGASVYGGYGAGSADENVAGGNGFVSIRQLSGMAPTTLVVNVSPSDATVNFSSVPIDGIIARNGNTITAHIGTNITYTVSKSGYTTYSETFTLNSQTTKNITLMPKRTVTVTSTSNPITEAQYSLNDGTWQNLTLTNNVGTITCDEGDSLSVKAKGGNYNEADGAIQGTEYTKTITVSGNPTVTFDFAYEAWDEVLWYAYRQGPGIGSNIVFLSLDPTYLSYSASNTATYTGIVYRDYNIEGVDFQNVEHYRFLIKHGTTFSFGVEIPDHRVNGGAASATVSYTSSSSYYPDALSNHFVPVDTVTISLTDNTATVSDLTTDYYTRAGDSIKVMRNHPVTYTLYKDGHTHTESSTFGSYTDAPTNRTISLTPSSFLGYTITFSVTPSDATIAADGITLSGNTLYIYKDDTSNHTYTITKTDYNTVNGTLTYPTDIYTRTITVTMQPSFTPETRTFSYTGAVQTYTVPSGCTKITIDCIGAKGGDSSSEGFSRIGGNGGRVQCTLNATSLQGQILYIYVGGSGNNDGWNGGGAGSSTQYGAGGGASDIRIGGTTLNDRKIIAGGGGGSGTLSIYGIDAGGNGGAGGGLTGGKGAYTSSSGGGNVYGGDGGTQSAGGGGGNYNGNYASNGSFGQGGSGEVFEGNTSPTAGGGGGLYGGGAGYAFVSGAGGGSSYTDSTLCTNVIHTQGYSSATGNGWITITTSNQ